jgi:branched-chain amino acid transport system permease protein
MEQLAQLLASGLALGAIYALVALGFVAIYRASKVFNFAQGELVTFGALFMVTLASPAIGVPWPLALIATMLVTGLLAAGVERLFLRPMVGRPVFVTVILTLFIGIILRTFIVAFWGTDPRGMPTPWDPMSAVTLGAARLSVNELLAIGAGGLALFGFHLLIKRSRLGIAMRATAVDQEAALAQGIPVGRVFSASWFIAGSLAALAGTFLAMFPRTADVNMGFIALRAFPAVLVGGLESAGGAVVASLLLGLLEVLAQAFVNPALGQFGKGFHEVFPYLVMILFLAVRPYGLFGQRRVERV